MESIPYRQVHLDFHTSEHIEHIGREFNPEEFARTLADAHVNSVTCFAKCHHGMLYYNTRFPARHPHLERNLLEEQVEVCHKYGIRAPIYLSAGFDVYAGATNAEWVEYYTDGSRAESLPLQPGWKKMCLNSPYTDYLLAQTEEVLELFNGEVDGLFFDIVSQGECCCRTCLSGMLREGYDPESSADRRRYAGKVLDEFKSRITGAIRERNKSCSIFYNGAASRFAFKASLPHVSHMEVESLPGGYWGYEHFPVSVRYVRNLGLPYIGMTGKFHKGWADFGGYKNPAALEYECFSALATGGGCSIGDQLLPSGRITPATYNLIGGVYKQVEEKEPWCKGARPVREVGIITPEVTAPDTTRHMDDASAGVHRMLKESHYNYDFLDFDMDLTPYKVIILPDVIRLRKEWAEKLEDYRANGGKLILTYQSGMAEESDIFSLRRMPAEVECETPMSPDYLMVEEPISEGIPECEHVMYERGYSLKTAPGAKVLAGTWKPYFERSWEHFCSHFHTPPEGEAGYPGIVANENVVYIGYPIFGMYKRHGARVYRQMVINSLKLLLPDEEKLVQTDAPTTAELMLNYQEKEDRYILHILHYIPERRYAATDTIEDIIPLYNVNINISLPEGYGHVTEVPCGRDVQSASRGGRVSFVAEKVNGHAMFSIGRSTV